MSGEDGPIELVPEPEPESELEPEPKPTRTSAQPLPRLWKSEPEPTEDESPPVKKAGKAGESEPAKKSAGSKAGTPKGKTKSAQGKGAAPAGRKGENKVLIEDTPTLDTYETRRRARIIMGTLSVACVFLLVWIVYRAFLYDPLPVEIASASDSTPTQSSPEARPSLDQEARFMFNRAQEFAKGGKTDQAVAMLTRVVKVYKGTATAKDSKAALDRAGQKLPLFSDRPLVVAQPDAPPPEPAPAAPPAVVDATPEQPQAARGQAALVLPANPPEVVLVPPGGAAPRPGMPAVPAISTSRSLPPGFQPSPESGVHESGWPLVIVGDRDGAPMVLVPGGIFKMGINESQTAEAPEHQVRLSTYYIDQHEVTNRQFRIFLRESHHRGQPPGKWLTDEKSKAEPANFPVVQVNFADAEAFATWAGKQISTEAQWEMAARSTDGRRYPWGDDAPKRSAPRTFRQIEEVMKFPEDKSYYGAYDMAGNVQEWTRDLFDFKYYHQFAKTVADNPTGPTPNSRSRNPQHVVRGASKNWSVTQRDPVPADRRLPYLGFRCVLAVEGPSPGGAPAAGIPAAAPTGPPAAQKKNTPIPF